MLVGCDIVFVVSGLAGSEQRGEESKSRAESIIDRARTVIMQSEEDNNR